jgi:predicted transcriptional regulator
VSSFLSVTTKPERLLPALELEVMKVLWQLRTATVGQVQIELRRRRSFAYTTVMTVLDRLAKKGAVSRQKQGRGYLYTPVLSRDAALRQSVDRILRDFFDSSPELMVAHLQSQHEPAPARAQREPEHSLDSIWS